MDFIDALLLTVQLAGFVFAVGMMVHVGRVVLHRRRQVLANEAAAYAPPVRLRTAAVEGAFATAERPRAYASATPGYDSDRTGDAFVWLVLPLPGEDAELFQCRLGRN